MFRQWLSDWVCRNYGHHWFTTIGTKTNEVGNEDGTSEIRVYVTTEYGECKRALCTHRSRAPMTETHTMTIKQPELDAFTYEDGECTTKFSQRIEQAP